MVGHPLWDREVVGSSPGRAIRKAFKMVPVAGLLGAQHYKSLLLTNIAQLTLQHLQKQKSPIIINVSIHWYYYNYYMQPFRGGRSTGPVPYWYIRN